MLWLHHNFKISPSAAYTVRMEITHVFWIVAKNEDASLRHLNSTSHGPSPKSYQIKVRVEYLSALGMVNPCVMGVAKEGQKYVTNPWTVGPPLCSVRPGHGSGVMIVGVNCSTLTVCGPACKIVWSGCLPGGWCKPPQSCCLSWLGHDKQEELILKPSLELWDYTVAVSHTACSRDGEQGK